MNRWHDQMNWIDAQGPRLKQALVELCAINSGSWNVAGIERLQNALLPLLAPLGVAVEKIALPPVRQLGKTGQIEERPLAPALRLRCRPDAARQVLLVGHLDTVFPADHPFQNHRFLDANTLNAPGAADLKGGLLVLVTALQALEQSPDKAALGWEVILNPDEEIGSLGSAGVLAEAATRHHIGLCYEPSLPTGELVSTRKGTGTFAVHVRGKAAHAGREHHLGRNAIVAAAQIAAALDALNGQHGDMTVNVGFIDGGGSVNVVPEHCLLKVNVRVSTRDQQQAFEQTLQQACAAVDHRDGFRITVLGSFHRPPKPMTPALQSLLDLLRDCGSAIDLDVRWQGTGGCCDGNNLAAAGLANVDNLGVRGGNIHSSEEFALLDSLTERAKLSAQLLLRLAAGEVDFTPFRKISS
ncbi:MAG TPA: hydrolase [Permianibacter sp.]|nr:hydrolase [Permianibacter sp.]